MNETFRLFVAHALSRELIAALGDARRELEPGLPSLRWVRPDGIHLTLKFLGDVPADGLDHVRGALSSCLADQAVEAFSVETAGLGVFPNPRAPRVLWAGFRQVPDPLYHVQQCVERAMEALGFPREQRPFRPHLTLGRFRRPLRRVERERLAAILSRHSERDFGLLDVSRLSLFRSTLLPEGARYDEVDGWPLAGMGSREGTGTRNEVTE